MKAKAFFAAVDCFHLNGAKMKRYLEDKRLTNIERLLLQAFLEFRDNNYNTIFSKIESQPILNDELVEAQRLSLLGAAYNNIGEFRVAGPYLEKAFEIFQRHQAVSCVWRTINLLFILGLNEKDNARIKEAYDLISAFPCETLEQRIAQARCALGYYNFFEDLSEGQKVIAQLEQLFPEMTEAQAINYLVDLFEFHVKEKDWRACDHVLGRMKNFRKFQSSENFKFMRRLLDYIWKSAPLYVYERDFQTVKILFLQLKLISLLDGKDITKAESVWEELRAISPKVYKIGFEYIGEVCLFSVALGKSRPIKSVEPFTRTASSKELALVELFRNDPGPHRQELIFEIIWGKYPESKSDITKLTRFIYLVKKNHDLSISFRKGCYFLETVKHKKAI